MLRTFRGGNGLTLAAFDLSLAATGYARYTGALDFGTLKPPKGATGHPRLNWIRECVTELAKGAELVIMENLSYGSNDASAQERAGLAYMIRDTFWKREQPFVLIAPTTLKKWVTGKGNAEKNLMLREVWRRFNVDAGNDNEADAVALAFLGRALVGDWEPQIDAQREVLQVVRKTSAEALERAGAVTA